MFLVPAVMNQPLHSAMQTDCITRPHRVSAAAKLYLYKGRKGC